MIRQEVLHGSTTPPFMGLSEAIPGIESKYSIRKGKVREIVDLGNGKMIIVATDGISTYDSRHPNGAPGKGNILTRMSNKWFRLVEHIVPNHLISDDLAYFPEDFQVNSLEGRSSLVKKLDMLPVECVVRGHLAGSGYQDYKSQGMISGISLPHGLRESEKLPEPIFTPSTKAENGHDIPINLDEMTEMISINFPEYNAREISFRARSISLSLYGFAYEYALKRGIIIADTKFELGLQENNGRFEIKLADEILTPDSSRFWPRDKFELGRAQESFDKPYIRDYVTKIGWDRNPPAPRLPDDVIEATLRKYRQAEAMLFD